MTNQHRISDREGLTAVMKRSNNLLAAALILTALPKTVKISQGTTDHCCQLISESLSSPNKQVRRNAVAVGVSIEMFSPSWR